MPTAAKITCATHANANLLFSDNDFIINGLVVLDSKYVDSPSARLHIHIGIYHPKLKIRNIIKASATALLYSA